MDNLDYKQDFKEAFKDKSVEETMSILFPDGDIKGQIKRDIREAARIEKEADKRIMEHIKSQLPRVGENVVSGRIKNMQEMGDIALDYFQNLRNRKIMTGIDFIDQRTRGVGPGEVMLIIARTSVGKTILGQNILRNMSKNGMTTLFFSLEMSLPTIYERWSQMEYKMGSDQFEYTFQKKEKEAREMIQETAERLICCYAIDQPALTIQDIEDYIAVAEQLEIGRKIKCVLIDYMGLIDTRDGYGTTYERISEIAREIAALAKRTDTGLIVIHQTSRAGGSGTTPVSFDMARDSGVIEEAVDYVITCWRAKEDPANTIVLKLDKNRNGPCFQKELKFDPVTLEIKEFGKPDPQPPEPVDEFVESDIPF